jgi:hypothetical protein
MDDILQIFRLQTLYTPHNVLVSYWNTDGDFLSFEFAGFVYHTKDNTNALQIDLEDKITKYLEIPNINHHVKNHIYHYYSKILIESHSHFTRKMMTAQFTLHTMIKLLYVSTLMPIHYYQ